MDKFYIEGKHILHVVDEATRFQSARWFSCMTSETLWKALRICQIDVNLGPAYIIVHDAGKNLIDSAFQSNTDMLHVAKKSIPVESANSMSLSECYHTPIR